MITKNYSNDEYIDLADNIFEIENNLLKTLVPPKIIKKVKPEYPDIDRKLGHEGKVDVVCTLDDNGNVIAAKLYRASKSKTINKSALEAAKKCKFTPAYFNNEPIIGIDVLLTYQFHLSGYEYY